jgi:hypothetical protein
VRLRATSGAAVPCDEDISGRLDDANLSLKKLRLLLLGEKNVVIDGY